MKLHSDENPFLTIDEYLCCTEMSVHFSFRTKSLVIHIKYSLAVWLHCDDELYKL